MSPKPHSAHANYWRAVSSFVTVLTLAKCFQLTAVELEADNRVMSPSVDSGIDNSNNFNNSADFPK